ncbi:Autophagy-related protein 27, partial [Rhizoctonia solani]
MSVKRRASKPKAILAVITLLQIGSVFTLPTTTDSVRFDCIFSATSGGHVLKYDLCPLLSRAKYRISRDVETPPSITRIHYDISLGGYIPWDGTLPARDQCEQGTNVCMTVISERPDHRLEPPRTIYVVPVAGNFPDRQLNVTFKLSRKIDSMGNLPLTVTFRGGLYMGVPQKAIFTFMCDSSVTEPSEPTLLSHADPLEDQGNHKLVWKSKHACPLGGYPSGQRDDPPEPTLPIPIHDPLPGSQDGGRMVGPGTVVIIVLLGMVIFGNLKRRWAGRHSTSRYRSFALSRVSPAVHHDADPRSPLTPHTPDAHHIRKYTTVD